MANPKSRLGVVLGFVVATETGLEIGGGEGLHHWAFVLIDRLHVAHYARSFDIATTRLYDKRGFDPEISATFNANY